MTLLAATGLATAAATAQGSAQFSSARLPPERTVKITPDYYGRQRFDRPKRADEILDYCVDWGCVIERLMPGQSDAQETVDTMTLTVQGTSTVVLANPTIKGGLLTVVISNGVAGEICLMEGILTTSKGRTYSALIQLRIGV